MIPHVDALAAYPRIRFMGSKHRLAPRLAELFATLPPGPAIDAFSGSGVVAYTLKAGRARGAGQRPPDFTATLAEALVANDDEHADAEDDVDRCARPTATAATSSPRRSTGLYFPDADHAFLDAAWSHVDELRRRRSGRSRSARSAWPPPGSSRAACSRSPRRATTTAAASCA